MSKMEWKDQLEKILGCTTRLFQIKTSEWEDQVGSLSADPAISPRPGNSAVVNNKLWIVVFSERRNLQVLEIPREQITEREEALLGWTIVHLKQTRQEVNKGNEAGAQLAELGEWIQFEFDSGSKGAIVPDHLTIGGKLFSEMVPFLLVSEHVPPSNTYSELEKLLNSFFEEDVLLIPLKTQEWLILAPVSLLSEGDNEEREGEEETVEEMLFSICSGLHGMLASEWIGECHLAVSHPVIPATSIIETLSLLQETVYLGRKFHIGENIHLSWLLHLERLLNSIPEAQRALYMEQMLNRSDVIIEPEILMTLETFFGLDCNVSETAKKLYIHRNTLLYRLDKLKQETGLDVRVFSDAVLVKIILLLYKVTKRR
ncbi:PucR family transcriptional regulator [Paenibacillus sp. GCM10012307]|uniref:Helix-turn-helix domain-containing protein n=1 Tax=Paenibacillus roseus TaxID=2798579 RepID=A0A934J373_9BACL|nr:helix-turn-helix domain-containing protein [Paenibacillus roseus]MBJ6360784.1 helix-turn-helix domain-containing protein [Paenibacillus roseus]